MQIFGKSNSARDSALSFVAFGYQAAATLALLFILAHALQPKDYAEFSFALAASQFVSIVFFEWIRLALTRFYPGGVADYSTSIAQTLYGLFFISMICLVIVAVMSALIVGSSQSFIANLTALAILQGFTDLRLTQIRFSGQFAAFLVLQITRATLILLISVTFAIYYKTPEAAFFGMGLAYCASLVFLLTIDKKFLKTITINFSKPKSLQYCKYGLSAGAGSTIYLGSALLIRATLISLASPNAVAALMFAFDLLQRLGSLMTTSIFSALYPRLIKLYAGEHRDEFVEVRGLLLRASSISIVMGSLGFVVFSLTISKLVLPLPISASLAHFAPIMAVVIGIRVFLSNVSSLDAHVAYRGDLIFSWALLDISAVTAIWFASTYTTKMSLECGFVALIAAGTLIVLVAWWQSRGLNARQ